MEKVIREETALKNLLYAKSRSVGIQLTWAAFDSLAQGPETIQPSLASMRIMLQKKITPFL
jgi:hypothetical protein